MKHQLKLTILLLLMFIITQFIGIYVVNYYSPLKFVDGKQVEVVAPVLPLGLESPTPQTETDYRDLFYSLIFAFVIAIGIFFILTKFNLGVLMKIWFLSVVVIALTIAFNSFISDFSYKIYFILGLAISLALLKVFSKNFLFHNLTELFIYPGIAAVFVPLFNFFWIIVFLFLISIYDMWAVWHSGIMQKMAGYQINTLGIFAGFFVPYLSEKDRVKIQKMKNQKVNFEKKKIKVNVAILGGGDVIFPIITAGVVLKTLGLFPALFVTAGATLGISYLFFFGEKKKSYPAMPYISIGILLGLLAWKLVL